jgi:UDP-N-acetylglucosamine transferase subunit ALG13
MNQAGASMKPKILVAPLDWGLGHATRCIPIIRSLIRHNCLPVLAGDGAVKILLRYEFPDLPFIDLPGYHIRYSAHKWTMPLFIASQIPKIFSVIKYENERLKVLVKEHAIDGIISDNRFGLYHPGVPSVFITHQLLVKIPLGSQAGLYLQQLNFRFINRFTQCWVPDHEHDPTLAGELSHPVFRPRIPLRYIGPLSRFDRRASEDEKHVLIILSGPEPQRTIFENLCIAQLNTIRQAVVLVRGLPGTHKTIRARDGVTIYNHLPSAELQEKILTASFVISRCGYSTVMDLAVLNKKSILVPTPGQTEQEYLARHLMANRVALCISQDKFKLAASLDLARNYAYAMHDFVPDDHLDSAMKSFLFRVQSGA